MPGSRCPSTPRCRRRSTGSTPRWTSCAVSSPEGEGRPMTKIGIFALQGDVREHARALEAAGCDAVLVRRPEELAQVDGLVLPGGESTTTIKLARTFELLDP